MLTELAVKNYLSIKDKQYLIFSSAEASADTDGRFLKEEGACLPKVASIYGPNGSGKSALLKALLCVHKLVKGYPPALMLPRRFKEKNTATCEIDFIDKKERYHYEIIFNNKRVLQEGLIKNGVSIFNQKWDKKEEYYLTESDYLSIKSKPLPFLLDTSPFLSARKGPNNIFGTVLEKPYNWITEKLIFLGFAGASFYQHLLEIEGYEKRCHGFLEFIQKFDLGIKNIIWTRALSGLCAPPIQEHLYLYEGEKLTFGELSAGTKQCLLLIWAIMIALEKGACLVVDDFDQHLHSSIISPLLNLFYSEKLNPHGAQLIFTAHNTCCLDSLHRNQVWFAEKNKAGGTQLFSLSHFAKRENENIQGDYLSGRFGGIPCV